jgi:S1-C subfamily serine protease
MLNLDMIGRERNGRVYVGAAGSGTTLRALLDRVAPRHRLRIDYSEIAGSDGSDHTSFLAKQVPALFFFSGLHEDYHKPSDTWDKINAQGAADILALVADVAEALREDPARPQFVRAEPSHGLTHGSGDAGPGGYGPYFGSVPDFGEGVQGVKFADVREGSPAARAGFRGGDILVEFDGKPVQNLYDFTYALQGRKPGDTVRVKVLRGGKPMEADVLLTVRP